MGWGYWGYKPSRPRRAKGGIKAQSKRGVFGESWWAKRWIAVLEGFNIGARLSRGRSYARRGQVLSIEIEKGRVKAQVQGSRATPYRIAIECKTLSADDCAKLAHALTKQARFTAKLLAGEMPQDIEQVFKDAGLSLFPARLGDLATRCSCPDWSNPCKHIAAVYYLLGEEFDRDPFLIFTLRGLAREDLLKLLDRGAAPQKARRATEAAEPSALPSEPLSGDIELFWNAPPSASDPFGAVETPPVAAALPKRLGGFPFWRGETPFLEAIEPIYAHASARGLDVFVSEGAAKTEAGTD
jgi:uncharacterized Zn finger protein